jgi:MFS family permease
MDDESPAPRERINYRFVVLGALLMVATLPGRTQGLGLITEPLLDELGITHLSYARINLLASLLGALACFPAGWLLDRFGLRVVGGVVVILLTGAVAGLSGLSGGLLLLFLWIFASRGLGQSALSVISIAAAGRQPASRSSLAMGLYALLLSILFAVAFVWVGQAVIESGWRIAWGQIGWFLALGVFPLLMIMAPGGRTREVSEASLGGITLAEALRSRAFWIFGGCAASFGLVSSGFGLFNESILAEVGYDQETYHRFLAVTTLFALIGQLACGWLSLRYSLEKLTGAAMLLYAASLLSLPFVSGPGIWGQCALMGIAAGAVTVIFFAVWKQRFGERHLGRILGAAQLLTVLASALGPVVFAAVFEGTGSYAVILWVLAGVVAGLGVAAMLLRYRE